MKKQEQENKEQEKNYMKLYHSENKESKIESESGEGIPMDKDNGELIQ